MVIYLFLLFSVCYCAVWSDVDDILQESDYVGNAYLMVGRGRDVLYTTQKGSDIEGDTKMLVASASKWVTSITFFRLIEEGIMQLDDKVYEYIPWWTNEGPKAEITLSMLLSFTSGFNGDNNCTGDSGATTLDECVRAIYEESFVYEPGTTFHYGGNHMMIASEMAVYATGLSSWQQVFATYLRDLPLFDGQMSGSFYTLGNAKGNPSGSLYTSVDAYSALLIEYVDRKIIPEYIDQLEYHVNPETIAHSPVTESLAGEWHYAHGCWLECSLQPFNDLCLTTNKRVSSPGAFGFYPLVNYGKNYWMILGTQNLITPGAGTYSVLLGQDLTPVIEEILTTMDTTMVIEESEEYYEETDMSSSENIEESVSKVDNTEHSTDSEITNLALYIGCISTSILLSLTL